MAVVDLILIGFTCLIFGLCSCIGYYVIYTGSLHFISRNKLLRKGRDGTAKVSGKKTNTVQLDGSNQTFYILTYSFSYQNKQYDIDHTLPKIQYDKLKINDSIYISFNPLNPSNSLPKIALTYPKSTAIKKIIFGTLIVIFSVFACLGIIYLFGYRDIIIFILNLCIVLIGFPFLALFCRFTVCRKKSVKQDFESAPEPKWTQEFVELAANSPPVNENNKSANILNTEQKEEETLKRVVSNSVEDDVRTPLVSDEISEQEKENKNKNKNEIPQKIRQDNEENDKQEDDADSDPEFAFAV